jgi:hypothetical protein
MNRQIKRAIGSAAALSLGLAGLVGVAAPAQAAGTTTFKIHLNVPKEVAQEWNIWYWNTGSADVGPVNNTIGESTVAGVTKDWTPNFVGEDAYGAFAEFTLPVTLTALNFVLRTTESWDGQVITPAVEDDPLTEDKDESAPAITVAIPASDKPMGGDGIVPAGESWWNVNTQKREYPAVVSYKVHANMSLKTAHAQGWNIYTWGPESEAKLQDYVVSTSKVVTTKVKGKTVKKTVVTKTYPYKGKVAADAKGWPFVGEDKYGAYAIVKKVGVYSGDMGVILRRSTVANTWAKQSQNYQWGEGRANGLPKTGTDLYISIGSNEAAYSVPTFVGRYGATASYANGNLTVTPVRPTHASMKGMFPTKIVVTAKKGGTSKSCTIASTATATDIATSSWDLASSCAIAIAAPLAGDGDALWEVYVQAESVIGKGPGATDKPNAKVTIPEPVVTP